MVDFSLNRQKRLGINKNNKICIKSLIDDFVVILKNWKKLKNNWDWSNYNIALQCSTLTYQNLSIELTKQDLNRDTVF